MPAFLISEKKPQWTDYWVLYRYQMKRVLCNRGRLFTLQNLGWQLISPRNGLYFNHFDCKNALNWRLWRVSLWWIYRELMLNWYGVTSEIASPGQHVLQRILKTRLMNSSHETKPKHFKMRKCSPKIFYRTAAVHKNIKRIVWFIKCKWNVSPAATFTCSARNLHIAQTQHLRSMHGRLETLRPLLNELILNFRSWENEENIRALSNQLFKKRLN